MPLSKTRKIELNKLFVNNKKENSKPETEPLKTDRETKNPPEMKEVILIMSWNKTWRLSDKLRRNKKKLLIEMSTHNWPHTLERWRAETKISKLDSSKLNPT
jgi:hypothetical protein